MIQVNRTPAPAPLAGDDSPAARELRRAETFYAIPANQDERFPFKVYRRREIKQALERMFHGKCAYCESKYLHSQPGDVEHFRPKGGYVVAEDLRKPGYWWLAAAWSNLLPSCIDCNRKRTQEFPGEVERGSGKQNLFPILDEADRARKPGAEKDETRLLLDPCRDRVAELLEFGEDGVVKPSFGLKPLDHRKVEASIRTYGLHRRRLNQARRERRMAIRNQYDALIECLRELKNDPRDERARRKLATALKSFLRFRQADQEYAQMAQQFIDPRVEKIGPFLEARLAATLPQAPGAPNDFLERFVAVYAVDEDLQDLDAELDDILGS